MTTSDFEALVRARRSCRAYCPDPVPEAHIARMLEAARLAPSACNRQPWRFAVVTDSQARARLVAEGLLPGLPREWIQAAPVLIVMGMRLSFVTHRLAPLFSGVNYPWMDLGIAGEHIVLQAATLGLGACWIGWIRPEPLRRIVGWPRQIRPAILFTVGWPASPPPDDEPGARRRPLSELVTWIGPRERATP